MKTKKIVKRSIFLVVTVLVLTCFGNIGFAVVLDEDNATKQMQGRITGGSPFVKDPLRQGQGRRKKATGYAPGEVIIKLKEKEETQALFTQSYSERKKKNISALFRIKSRYKLRDEETVFKGLHNKLKRKNLTLQQLQAQTEAKSRQAQRRRPEHAKKVDLLPIYVLKTDEDVLETCARLNEDPEIEYAEPNYIMKAQIAPDDPYYYSSGSWGQDYDDLWGIKKIQGEQAWDISQGEGVVVAVIDTGVDYNHPDLAENIWVNEDEIPDNGIDDDRNGYIDDIRGWDFAYDDNDPMDHHFHGTHVAGTVAAVGNNGIGIIGVAPQAKIMALKGLSDSGGGTESGLANAILYAVVQGAKVINCSWGGKEESQLMEDIMAYAFDNGVLVVAAAGNSTDDVSNFFPASISSVTAVSAFNQNDEICYFSNYGAEIDVAAPGGGLQGEVYNILSLKTSSEKFPQGRAGHVVVGERYLRLAGTSMAAPHVSGIAALVISNHPGFSNENVRQIIRFSADDVYAPGFDVNSGYGRVNAEKAISIELPISAHISYPKEGNEVFGVVTITGSAYGGGFEKYELFYGKGENPLEWILITSSNLPVRGDNGILAEWDTPQFPEGKCKIRLVVTINGAPLYDSIGCLVNNYNEPPEIIATSNKGFIIGLNRIFHLEAHDPDGDRTITFSATHLPDGASFTKEGKFSWTPGEGREGRYTVEFTASDREYSSSKELNLVVLKRQEDIIADVHAWPPWFQTKEMDFDGDNIVWLEWIGDGYYDGSARVKMYNIPSAQISTVYQGEWIRALSLSGNTIAWNGGSGYGGWVTTSDVFMYDIAQGLKTQITDDSWMVYFDYLDIDGNIIVWSAYDFSYYMYAIFMYDMETDNLQIITPIDNNKFKHDPRVSGDKAVWTLKHGKGNESPWDINLYDILTGESQILWTDDGRLFSNPAARIDADRVVSLMYPSPDIAEFYIYNMIDGTKTKLFTESVDDRIFEGVIAIGGLSLSKDMLSYVKREGDEWWVIFEKLCFYDIAQEADFEIELSNKEGSWPMLIKHILCGERIAYYVEDGQDPQIYHLTLMTLEGFVGPDADEVIQKAKGVLSAFLEVPIEEISVVSVHSLPLADIDHLLDTRWSMPWFWETEEGSAHYERYGFPGYEVILSYEGKDYQLRGGWVTSERFMSKGQTPPEGGVLIVLPHPRHYDIIDAWAIGPPDEGPDPNSYYDGGGTTLANGSRVALGRTWSAPIMPAGVPGNQERNQNTVDHRNRIEEIIRGSVPKISPPKIFDTDTISVGSPITAAGEVARMNSVTYGVVEETSTPEAIEDPYVEGYDDGLSDARNVVVCSEELEDLVEQGGAIAPEDIAEVIEVIKEIADADDNIESWFEDLTSPDDTYDEGYSDGLEVGYEVIIAYIEEHSELPDADEWED